LDQTRRSFDGESKKRIAFFGDDPRCKILDLFILRDCPIERQYKQSPLYAPIKTAPE
jgi:hypothetical protein